MYLKIQNNRVMMILFTTFLLVSSSFATNGYFSHGYGTQSKSMAGAGAALPGNTLSAATNPAAMVFLGKRYDVALSLFSPNREYTVVGNPSMMQGTFGLTPGTVESGSKWFVIPAAGANWMIDENGSLGLSVFGNGGMNTDYDTKTFYGTEPTGVNLSQLFVAGTYSRRLNARHAFGISAIFAYQMFSAEGLQAFANFSRNGEKLSNNDTDNSLGFGFRVGYIGKIVPRLSVGASYQSKKMMGEFKEYSGLFAEEGDFDIPASWTAGLVFDITSELLVAFDVQQILYSGIKSVTNPLVPADFQQNILLGDENGAGFGWEDMTVFKFGAQWKGIPGWTFRSGYSFGEQPIPEKEVMFNMLAPGVIEQHITFGMSRMIGENEISLAVMHAFSNSVKGHNSMEVPGQQTIELQMDQLEVELGFSF